MANPVIQAPTAGSAYTGLYRTGGAAAWIAAALTVGEVIVLAFHPQPGTVDGWFALLQNDRIIGLLDLWGLEVLMYLSFTLVFLALYAALRQVGESRMAVALAFALLGIAVFLATNNPFTMLSLSDQYAAATTDAQRAALLAAGQTVLANTNQRAVGSFNLGFFLVSVAGLLASSAMLRSDSFGRPVAYAGLAAHALSLADYLRQALTASVTITLLVVLLNALFLVIWYALVGRRLYRLGSTRNVPGAPVAGLP